MQRDRFIEEVILPKIDTPANRVSERPTMRRIAISQSMLDTYGKQEILEACAKLECRLPGLAVPEYEYAGGVRPCGVKSLRISTAAIDSLCALIGRNGRRVELEKKITEIEKRMQTAPAWLNDVYYSVKLSSARSGNITDIIDDSCDLAIRTITEERPDMYVREFSAKVLGDSKLFEKQYKDQACRILRKHPEISEYSSMSDNDVLHYFGLKSYNTYMEIKGPVECFAYGRVISGVGVKSGIVLNEDLIRNTSAVSLCGIKRVITIENKANYYAAEFDGDTVFIYTGGFPSPAEGRIYKMIEKKAPGAMYLHFGDMDLGGIEIFNHIKKNYFPDLNPHMMDARTYRGCINNGCGYEMSKDAMARLKNVDAGLLEPLRLALLETCLGVEQETLLSRSNEWPKNIRI